MPWDPDQYLKFAAERRRPFVDLLARVGPGPFARIVDLGCGEGRLTAEIVSRWPAAKVIGVDRSAEMIARARAGYPELELVCDDVCTFADTRGADLLLSNAALHWVPEHLPLISRWVEQLAPGGCLAFQVPANFNEPSHQAVEELLARQEYQPYTPPQRPASLPVETYLRQLLPLSREVDAWETLYYHVLAGEQPVLQWLKGTTLRPILARLPAALVEPFCQALAAMLRERYPTHEGRVVFPFRRRFVVAFAR